MLSRALKMGGGDLNSKKSWHPNSTKNQEKTWKAEQVLSKDSKRLEQLKRELDNERFREEIVKHGQSSGVLEEKSNKQIDWMYKEPSKDVDREQYLLGKAVDKHFEKLATDELNAKSNYTAPPKNHVEHECIPFSIRNLSSNSIVPANQVDMARKLLEDPLVAIRKKEVESRAQLLQNPVKLKELTMMLEANKSQRKKKKDVKKKKKKTKDKELDKKILEKLKLLNHEKVEFDLNALISKILKSSSLKKHSKKKKKSRKESSSETESKSSDSSIDKSPMKRRKEVEAKDETSKYKKLKISNNEYSDKRKGDHIEKGDRQIKELNDLKKTSDQRSERNRYKQNQDNTKNDLDKHSDVFRKKNYSDRDKSHDSNRLDYHKRYSDEKFRSYGRKNSENTKVSEGVKHQKLNEKEKEEKRREMMRDAIARDQEREKNVKYYSERDKKEEMRDKAGEHREHFVEKQLRAAAGHGSLESRIKSNIYNIQRSYGNMDSNFAKR